jgi:hypothetical protein
MTPTRAEPPSLGPAAARRDEGSASSAVEGAGESGITLPCITSFIRSKP